MSKTHVCHITTVHPSRDVRIFHKECKSLREAGFEVSLIHNDPSEKEEEAEGVQFMGLGLETNSRIGRILKVPKEAYRKAREVEADLYHFHDPDFLPYAKKLAQRGHRVIYDAHEDVPRQILSKHWIPSMFRKLLAKLFERYEESSAKKMQGVASATDPIRERFLSVNSNVWSIKNFPRIEQLSFTPFQQRKKNKICYIGSITKVRGVKELVEALPMTDAELDLAGDFNPASFRDELKELPGWSQVNELGFLGREGVQEVLGQASIGMVTLHPIINYLEALPVKMFEYMASGMPVIASNFPILERMVEENKFGTCVDPLNPRQIANAINEFLNDRDKAELSGKNGREAVEERFNWELEGHRLVKFYRSILDPDKNGNQ